MKIDLKNHFHRATALGGFIGAPRADAGTLTELRRVFSEHHAETGRTFADLRKSIEGLNTGVDDLAKQMAAMKVGGAGAHAGPEAREHSRAFHAWFRNGANERELRDLQVKAALVTDSDPDGGYLVPEELAGGIDRVLGTVSALRSVSRVITISAGVYKKPVSLGGATGGWVGERQARPETTTPTLTELAFPAMELYANPAATQTMLDDSRFDIAAWLGEEVSITFAEMEGAAFISGNGVNKPRGLLTYDTVANASYEWGKLGFVTTGVASALSDGSNNGIDALLSLKFALKSGYRSNARWLMNSSTAAIVSKLKSIGDNPQYLWQPSMIEGQPDRLLGFPVTIDDNMPDIGSNTFPIAFGNFERGYLIVDRFGIRVLRDPYTNKPYVHFYTTKRVGGGVQNFEAIKLLKVST